MEMVQEQADATEDSTPTTGDDSASAQATAVADPVESPATEKRAQSAAEQVDPDRAAFDRLSAGEKANDVRQNPKSVDPSPESSDQEQRAPAKSKAEDTAKSAAYQGTDPKNIDALRRAQLLPPDPDVWNSMAASVQKALIGSARNLLKQKGQISQQLGTRVRPGQGTLADDTNDIADAGDEEDQTAEDTGGTAGIPPQAAPQQPRGVRAQTQTAARPDAQPGLDEAFAQLNDYVSEDVSNKLKQAILGQYQSLTERHKHELVTYQQELQRQAKTVEGMARVYFLPQEREGFETLEREAPGKVDAETHDKILRNASIFFQASLNDREPLDWRQSIEMAGRSILHPDIKQQAQVALIDRRKQALRASPAKGNLSTRPDRALSIEDRDKAAWEQLTAGRQAKDVRAVLS